MCIPGSAGHSYYPAGFAERRAWVVEQKAEGYRYYAGLDAELSETREMIVSESS